MKAKNPAKFETTFDIYSVVGVIGEGGSGRVFEVKNSANITFALKCLRPELVTGDKRKRFKNEIDFCSKNEHPNLIRVLDFGLVDWDGEKTPFYVMPRCGSTLRGLMEKKIPPNSVLPAFAQILDGVEAAHLLGVWHRDIKPENILYDLEKKLFVVADLGIAHFEEEILATQVETKKGDKLLNVGYSAPEQRTKGATVDRRADIYALGQMLNEMFTGSIPEGAGHSTIAGVAPDLGYLDGLVEKMRQQNPDSRPQTIADVKKELIGRKNEFVSFQELNSKRKRVVKASAPGEVLPVNIIDVEWNQSTLSLTLDRAPEAGWVQWFQNPRRSYSNIMDAPPHAYQFAGPSARIRIDERQAQDVINQFKIWSPWATESFQRELIQRAAKSEREQREKLAQEIAAAEAKERVSKSLKF